MIAHSFAKTGMLMWVLALSATPLAAQDVVFIKSGTFVVDDQQNNSLTLSGTQGFKLDGGNVSLGSKEHGAIGLCPDGEFRWHLLARE